jgi:hypothetical protein
MDEDLPFEPFEEEYPFDDEWTEDDEDYMLTQELINGDIDWDQFNQDIEDLFDNV